MTMQKVLCRVCQGAGELARIMADGGVVQVHLCGSCGGSGGGPVETTVDGPASLSVAVAFRAAAGPGIGLGHLLRCAALSDELRRRGAQTTAFIAGDETVANWARELQAFDGVQWLNPRLEECTSWSIWRNTHPQPPWRRLAVLDQPWQPGQTLLPPPFFPGQGPPAETVAVFLDEVAPVGPIDLAINPNVDWADADWSWLALRAKVLAGPRFACLWRPPVRDPSRDGGRVWRVLVTRGGSDPQGVTAEVVRRLPWELEGHEVNVVAGPGMAPGVREALRQEERRWHDEDRSIVLHEALHGLGPVIEAADLAICAGGSTLYELACAGVPAVVLPQTPAEAHHAAALQFAGTCLVTDLAGLEATVGRLSRDAEWRAAMSAAGRRLVDGHGAERVAAALLAMTR